MNLHQNPDTFKYMIQAAADKLEIRDIFIEKDYWISNTLYHLAKSKYASNVVFKGGTSLSKGYRLIDRFSEDVDIAIIHDPKMTGNQVKTLIKCVEKEMTQELHETEIKGVTGSKGSRYRKSFYQYEGIHKNQSDNKLIVEINSFDNPYSYSKLQISSILYDFLSASDMLSHIEQYGLNPFSINVLNKEQTLIEKIASLVRFSFDSNPSQALSKKIRHFYDLYFLTKDAEISEFVNKPQFSEQLEKILIHDMEIFDIPKGWATKNIINSPIFTEFDKLWDTLKKTYVTELSALAYREIPDEKLIAESFTSLIRSIKKTNFKTK